MDSNIYLNNFITTDNNCQQYNSHSKNAIKKRLVVLFATKLGLEAAFKPSTSASEIIKQGLTNLSALKILFTKS